MRLDPLQETLVFLACDFAADMHGEEIAGEITSEDWWDGMPEEERGAFVEEELRKLARSLLFTTKRQNPPPFLEAAR